MKNKAFMNVNSANELNIKLGKKIKLTRIKEGYKQYDLANQIGISANYLSLIEAGKKNPSLKTIHEIAKKLNVSVSSLLENDPILDEIKTLSSLYNVEKIAKEIHGLHKRC